MTIVSRSAVVAALFAVCPPVIAQAQEDDRFYLDADEWFTDQDSGDYIARGNVRVQSGDRVLLADELIYTPEDNRIVARGGVQIFEGREPAQFADQVVLDSALGEGVAMGFATLMENNARAAAGTALRRPDGTVELNDAYYTACDLCEDGADNPTWRLRASRVVRDTENKVIFYRDARLEVLGAPVLYTPVFAHADPSAERQSGLLFPIFNNSSRLGFVYQQPYLFALGPSQELIVSPRYMGKVAPLLQLDWRRRFYSGTLDIQTSFTNERNFDRDGKFDDKEFRGHVFAEGQFRLSDNWRWGFGVEAVSDDLYLRRYDYEESPDRAQGLFTITNQRLLINQFYAVTHGEYFHGDATAIHFNSTLTRVDDDTLALISPLVRFNAQLPLPGWAGDLDFGLNAINIHRGLGDEYTRASMDLDWQRPTILPGGIRAELFALGRVDAYRTRETDSSGTVLDSRNFTRTRGAAGLDLSLPFIRSGQFSDIVIAPRVAIIAANGGDADERPLNADSESVEFQRSQFFDANRANGFDIWEDGSRIDAGLELNVDIHSARLPASFDAFVGRSYRLDGDERFGSASGLAEDDSDWIVEADVDLGYLSLDSKARFDGETSDLNRLDLKTSFEAWRLDLSSTYTRRTDEAAPRQLEELKTSVQFRLTDHWSAFYDTLEDLEEDETRRSQAGLAYRDECTSFRVMWERDNTQAGNLGPSESVKLEIVLFTLGGISEE